MIKQLDEDKYAANNITKALSAPVGEGVVYGYVLVSVRVRTQLSRIQHYSPQPHIQRLARLPENPWIQEPDGSNGLTMASGIQH
jgi:hypothetical protein